MAAFAPTVADAIESAGGWLFDQALAGWDVTVITAEQADCRPLRILGVRDHTLESMLSYRADGSCLSAVALSAAMFAADERVRRMVLAVIDSGLPELRFWGDADVAGADFSSAGLDAAASPVAHRLSAAARAFKAQALAAAAVCGEPPADTEVFRRGSRRGLGLVSSL
ncbi:MAG: hypothetical protein JWM19_2584 [Actinomycetia bacterium]|nr:hypothetical protein [Actinomycetes bacterium]